MANGKLVWLNYDNIDALTTLTKSFDVKSPNNVVSILVDLAQKTKDIQLKQMRVCPTCNKEFEIERNTSGAYKLKDHIRHCDLEETNCKQTCRIQHRVKIDASGTTTANAQNSETTGQKDQPEKMTKTQEEIDEEEWKLKGFSESLIRALKIDRGYVARPDNITDSSE